ncbi:MAG: thioredoxin family protein [Planctomycetota bacterium]
MRFVSTRSTRLNLTRPWVVLSVVFAASASRADDIAWQTDLQAAHATAQAENKPLLLHFTSDNCVWCDRLEAGAFQSPDVQAAIAGGFVPLKVHAAQAPQLVKMFGVKGFPTDVVVWPTGQTLAHSVSPQDPTEYVAMLAGTRTKVAALTQSTVTPPAEPDPTAGQSPVTQYAANDVGVPSATPKSQSTQMSMPNTQPNQVPAMTAAARAVPGDYPGGATAQLAGARTDGMSLGMPGPVATMESESGDASIAFDKNNSVDATEKPRLALEGFCSVSVIDEQRWAEGDPKFGVIHLGKLYLFETQAKMATFLADPEPYTPILNGIDVIRFFEERRVVPGKRQFGVQDPIHGRMFFFADEAALNHFDVEYQRYVDAAIDVMNQAVASTNP